jgi:serum/glucocorticoid-regulated kinase 2
MYEMLVGEPPFYSDDIPTMYKNIREGVLRLPRNLSEECKNCIRVLLYNYT